jgi:hypothetical protein
MACSSVIVEPVRLLPLPRFLSEQDDELAFEVTFGRRDSHHKRRQSDGAIVTGVAIRRIISG